MSFLGIPGQSSDPPDPLPGAEYISTLYKYLSTNQSRFAPPTRPSPSEPSLLQQSYTLLTLGLDPNSAPLSRNVKAPLTLGFGLPSTRTPPRPPPKPLLLRLPPDRLLYLLLRWQSLPQGLQHVGRTDEPVSPGISVAARGARVDMRDRKSDGDVESVRSWVGSMRSVSMGSMRSASIPGLGWLKKEEIDEDQLLIRLYSILNVLPALLIHPPFLTDRPIAELIDAGGYTQLGGIDVRVPLDVLRNLQILELEGYDPRGLLIPPNPILRSLTIRDVQDADDWLEELLVVDAKDSEGDDEQDKATARFPSLRHLSLHNGSLLDLPHLPLASLTHLDLSHNLLETLPTSLSSLHSLQSLNLSDNVIRSLRQAPSVLGNVTSLNLSRNRVDCVVGLERVLGLERIDLRGNSISQWDEIGRLSELPQIKEIWYADNPFDGPSTNRDETRIELGVLFAQSGNKEVVFDDRPWTWAESRKIEGLLQSRGVQYTPSRAHSRSSSAHTTHTSHHLHPITSSVPPTPARLPAFDSGSISRLAAGSTAPSGSSSPVSSHVQNKKRRAPRRVINLDEPGKGDISTGQVVGGSMRLPPKTIFEGEEEFTGGKGTMTDNVPGAGTENGGVSGSAIKVKKKERRRVSASMFDFPSGG